MTLRATAFAGGCKRAERRGRSFDRTGFSPMTPLPLAIRLIPTLQNTDFPCSAPHSHSGNWKALPRLGGMGSCGLETLLRLLSKMVHPRRSIAAFFALSVRPHTISQAIQPLHFR